VTTIEALQEWYLSQCNEDWEHTYGLDIGTLDNPGWSVSIELTGTDLEHATFPMHSYGIGANSQPENQDWIVCKVEKRKFIGRGGPRKLEEIINIFLAWAKARA
jgi:hypothetical protein